MKTLTSLDPLGETLLHSLWQGTAIVAILALTLHTWMKHSSPAARQIAAWLALLGILISSAATLAREIPAAAPLPAVMGDRAPATGSIVTPLGNTQPFRLPSPRSWPGAAGLAWMVGSLLALGQLGAGWWRLRRLSGEAMPVADADIVRLFERTRARLGIRERIGLRVCAAGAIDSPSMAGFFWPVVLIPAGLLAGAPAGHLQAIFAHELAHFRRWDYVTNLLLGILESLYFFHPAVWWIGRTIRIEREHACDDVAASRVSGAADYARALAWLEMRRSAGGSPPPAPAAVADGLSTLRRIERLLSGASRPIPIRQGLISDRTLLTWIPGALAALLAWLPGAQVRGQAVEAMPGRAAHDENWLEQWEARIALVARARQFLDGPSAVFDDSKGTMFSSGIVLEKGGRMLRLEDESPVLFPDFPNAWVLRHGLNPLDGDLPRRDPDRDGFENREEYLGGTDPKSAEDHPPYLDKLRFLSRNVRNYGLKYDARLDENRAQIRRLRSAIWEPAVFHMKPGEASPDHQFRVRELNVADVSIVYLPTGEVWRLPKGGVVQVPTWFAELRLDIDGEAAFFVKVGETFSLSREPSRRYRLESVSEEGAIVASGDQPDHRVRVRPAK